ncbi:MAG: flippase-like domain-containing protein [Chloroflexia bacterium]|nr:flippase-like domain-containing protein [Chloroflexia bacterium]MDQ3412745.1 flippase-like domain-containing protein [Chloroflexota bacterium]
MSLPAVNANEQLDRGRDPIVSPLSADTDAGPTDAEIQPGSLRARFLRPRTFISFAVALAILIFFARRLDVDPAAIWQQVRRANPWLYAAAFIVWYGIFVVRAVRWKVMLVRAGIDRAHGYPVPGIPGIVEMLLLSWFANCIVPAKLGDAYRSYLLKRETRSSFSTGMGTIVAERLTDLVVLFVMMTTAGIVVFSGRLPVEARQSFVLGAGLMIVAGIGLAGMWFSRGWLERFLPARFRDHYARLHTAIFQCLRRPGLFLGIGVVVWLMEGMRLWLVAASLQAGLPPATALFIALMGSLLTTLPVTPAGLGVVELGTGAVLIQVVGMDPTLAASVIVLDRVIGYWSLVAIGLVVVAWRARRERRLAL